MKHLSFSVLISVLILSCNNAETTADADNSVLTQEQKEERNKEAALESVRAFNEKNVDVIMKHVDSSMVEYGDGSMPPLKNIDSSRYMLQAWLQAVPDIKGEYLLAVADGDYVMVYGEWSGTWKGDLMGMKASGKSFKVNDVDIFKFNDAGKMIEHRSVQSGATLGAQIGMPIPGQQQQN
ncbi:MAG: ester cyclase [Flavisolibacter sp.]|jgi:predicted ester cyclase|nr:ester cyclase [Flavisolibacter sp.]